MAHLTANEAIEKFGPIHNLPETSLCDFIKQEFQAAADAYSQHPTAANEKRVLQIAMQCRANHCSCILQ